MLSFVHEAGFISQEVFKDPAKRREFVESMKAKALAHGREKGLSVRGGKPLVIFAKNAAAHDDSQREVMILCVFES